MFWPIEIFSPAMEASLANRLDALLRRHGTLLARHELHGDNGLVEAACARGVDSGIDRVDIVELAQGFFDLAHLRGHIIE